jgi:uncharacterized protein (DUF58 family)
MHFHRDVPSSQPENKPKVLASQAAGYLLHKPGLAAFGAILVLAAWSNQTSIVLLMGLFLSAALLAKGWSRLSLMGVTCQRSLSQTRVFPGDTVNLILHVSNRKPLPLPWIRVDDHLPPGLTAKAAASGLENGSIRRRAALLWYRSVRWTCPIQCSKRGFYPFGPLETTSGDIFGLYSRSLAWNTTDHIIVYPRIFPVRRMPIPPVHPMGNSKTERRIFQDPTRTIGVREYRPGDSLRNIHWKASARTQGLQVKVFEPTALFKVALFLGVDTFSRENSLNTDDFELGIDTVASIAYDVMDHGGPAGVFVNTRLADTGQGVSIPPSGDRKQLGNILEALAKATPSWRVSFGPFLEKERRSLKAGTTLVLVISKPPDDFRHTVLSLREAGHPLLVLLVGEQEKTPLMAGVSWLNVRSPMDLVRNGSGGGL